MFKTCCSPLWSPFPSSAQQPSLNCLVPAERNGPLLGRLCKLLGCCNSIIV